MENVYLTVTALNKYIKYKFDHDTNLAYIFLKGEVSNFKRHSRGHFYFTIKDDNSQISAIMFSDYAKDVTFELKEGTKVLVEGKVIVYEQGGNYQVNVIKIQQDGIGDLFLAYEKLKKELFELGLFNDNHKVEIPRYPNVIGVITSPTGAVIKDIINTVNRRYPIAKIILYPSLVQGPDAKDEIVKQIKLANKQNIADVLIIGRGGGSIEDLWAFNERDVAFAIYESKIPIVSAVGHETDFTIADYVADKRAPTPTAAAEISTSDITEIKKILAEYKKSINRSIINYFEQKRLNLMHLDERLDLKNPNELIKMEREKIDRLSKNMDAYFIYYIVQLRNNLKFNVLKLKNNSPEKIINDKKSVLDNLHSKVENEIMQIIKNKNNSLDIQLQKLKVLNPLEIMQKGFSISYKNGVIVKSILDVNINDNIEIKLKDGTLKCDVLEKRAN